MTLKRGLATASMALVTLAILTAGTPPPAAQEVSKDSIRCRLDPTCPKPGFRSLPFGKRGIDAGPPQEDVPNAVSFHVTFAYNSAELLTDSLITLDALGAALADPSLKDFRFMIAGHTDGRGSEEYNQKLSERRADAVASYLVTKFHLDRTRLAIKGYGKQRLFDPDRPEDQVNRRVQVVNLTANGQ